MAADKDLRALVFDALNNRKRNHFVYVCYGWALSRVAGDLADYAPSLEDIDPATLIPHIQAWRAEEAKDASGE